MVSDPIPKGARVRKVWGEPLDMHALGAEGEVIWSVGPVPEGTMIGSEDCGGEWAYMVKWDDFPVPVFVRGKKVEEVK